MSRDDPLQTDFFIAGQEKVLYTSHTVWYQRPHGTKATTTITREDRAGERLQVGVIEWPVSSRQSRPQIFVGTRPVEMTRTGLYTSPEKFTAADHHAYEWQISDSRPQLVPLEEHRSAAYIATFVHSSTGSFLTRKHSASLFIPPEGVPILDDIVVTFVYFESQWRNKERRRSRSSMSVLVA
ncbi:hypothetical protein PAXRUDRAFT_835034 [Paxillus rubicundulus Ve08.2h10]|uniref:DUF6593 domain-containing protein n=1 Tax=Paxillus rubicundulus Ve08.2h10 TaxID=930991 RepID=A0A0D0D9X5_9AGAM|nr:hypothetical protein PAXRUDRAFT_835034 [Paxillus rubicundulus Ve08.2h10]